MRLKRRQVARGLTDRALAKAADVARCTVYRAKTGQVSRPYVMGRIAGALGCEVWDIDEFRNTLREKVYREAEKQGGPAEVIDEAEQMAEMFTITVPDEGTVQHAAYRLMGDIIAYLDRSGRTDLIDRAIRERQT